MESCLPSVPCRGGLVHFSDLIVFADTCNGGDYDTRNIVYVKWEHKRSTTLPLEGKRGRIVRFKTH